MARQTTTTTLRWILGVSEADGPVPSWNNDEDSAAADHESDGRLASASTDEARHQ